MILGKYEPIIILTTSKITKRNGKEYKQGDYREELRPYVGQSDNHIGWVTLILFSSIYPTDSRTHPAQFPKKYLELTILKNITL